MRESALIVVALVVCLLPDQASAQCESVHYQDVTALHLIPAVDQHFTICYDARYAADVDFARHWLVQALRIGAEKYHVISPRHDGKPLHTIVFLVPHSTSSTRPGYVVNHCCTEDETRVTSEIHYLTPGAWPDWTMVGICWPNMDEYHAHYLVHEMMHTVQLSLETDDTDSFSKEALAEYDAFVHTTEWGRTGGINNLIELAYQSHRDRIYMTRALDGTVKLSAENRYVGGAVIMLFYASQYGESFHKTILAQGAPEVDVATFETFRAWFNGREEHGSHERCRG